MGIFPGVGKKVFESAQYITVCLLGIAIFGIVGSLLDAYAGYLGAANFFIALLCGSMAYGLGRALIERARDRERIGRFLAARKRPQKPVDILSQDRRDFRPAWSTVLWVPEAGISMPADNSALQIASIDLAYDVLIPIQLITQIEFDPGDGPPGQRYPGMSRRREWLGLPFAPTVYLGLRLSPSADVMVYALCFHPKNDEDARILHQRLLDGQQAASQSISFPLETTITEEMLPGSFESRYLRTSILRRFWPEYRATTVREWLNG